MRGTVNFPILFLIAVLCSISDVLAQPFVNRHSFILIMSDSFGPIIAGKHGELHL
jgi:hypothetical protein